MRWCRRRGWSWSWTGAGAAPGAGWGRRAVLLTAAELVAVVGAVEHAVTGHLVRYAAAVAARAAERRRVATRARTLAAGTVVACGGGSRESQLRDAAGALSYNRSGQRPRLHKQKKKTKQNKKQRKFRTDTFDKRNKLKLSRLM